MTPSIDMNKLANKHTVAILEDMLQQIDEQKPLSLNQRDKIVNFLYMPSVSISWNLINILKRDKVFDMEVISMLSETLEKTGVDYYDISLIPNKLDKWIKKNLPTHSNSSSNKQQPLPQDVEWDEKSFILKISDKKIQIDRSKEYGVLFRIYIEKHGSHIPHSEIIKDDARFTPKKISSTIGTMKKKFVKIKRIQFETKRKGAYRLIIK